MQTTVRLTRYSPALIVLLSLVIQGCYLCPYGDYDKGFSYFGYQKLPLDLKAKTWHPVFTHTFIQPVVLNGGYLDLQSDLFLQKRKKVKLKYAALVWDQFGRLQYTLRDTIKFDRKGEMIEEVEEPVDLDIGVGYTLRFDFWSNKTLKEGDQMKIRASYRFEEEQTP